MIELSNSRAEYDLNDGVIYSPNVNRNSTHSEGKHVSDVKDMPGYAI